jgi:two-component system response regulator CpxR
MSMIRMFGGTYCHAEEVSAEVVRALDCELLDDQYVVKLASERLDISENKLTRTLSGKVSAFDNFTHERERITSGLRLIVAELTTRDNVVLFGSCSQLVPTEISHVLSVCVIADIDYRIELAVQEHGLSEKEARRMVQKDDESRILWTDHVLGKGPWDSDIYDVLIPTNQVNVKEAADLIRDNARSDALKPTEASLQAVKDFRLAAEVEMVLGKAGHNVAVSVKRGKLTLTINKHALMLSRLEEELKSTAVKVEGVGEIEVKVGPDFYRSGVYHRSSFELPDKILLVDDEKEFVQTLSERLQVRGMGSAVVHDGEQALSFIAEEEPDVMVLDLKMPGIDGIEVLRQIRQEHQNIEVIVLTGHGSKKDEETCMKLGAFAYLKKPVDIDKLSQTMQEAYRRIQSKESGD